MRGSAVNQYEHFEASPETIEQFANSDRFKDNYSIDYFGTYKLTYCELDQKCLNVTQIGILNKKNCRGKYIYFST